MLGREPSILDLTGASLGGTALAGKVFAPPPPQPTAPGTSALSAPGSEQPGGGGLPSDVNPSIATEGPQGRPDLTQLFAGLTARGQPNLSGVVSRMAPAVNQ